eukprot:scaffold7172_cov113-Isochrysis_galbana.AAC.3
MPINAALQFATCQMTHTLGKYEVPSEMKCSKSEVGSEKGARFKQKQSAARLRIAQLCGALHQALSQARGSGVAR